MGNIFTVEVYGQWWPSKDYSYRQVWQGESFIGATRALWKHRRMGSGCLKLEWRPRRTSGEGSAT